MKTFTQLFENAKILYKKNLYNNTENNSFIKNNTIKNILEFLELGEKIESLPKLNFDFKNFDRIFSTNKENNFTTGNNINFKSNQKNINSNNLEQVYICDICNEVFSNGQGLGGHMSRKHPNKSLKYKFKKETREKRNLKREIIYEAKRRILKKYNEIYDDLMITIEGRKLIKRICKDNKEEYYRIKREIKINMK